MSRARWWPKRSTLPPRDLAIAGSIGTVLALAAIVTSIGRPGSPAAQTSTAVAEDPVASVSGSVIAAPIGVAMELSAEGAAPEDTTLPQDTPIARSPAAGNGPVVGAAPAAEPSTREAAIPGHAAESTRVPREIIGRAMPEPAQGLPPVEATSPGDVGPMSYMVQRGDTVFALAQRFNTRIEHIAWLNPALQPDRVQAGEVIFIQPGAQDDVPLPTQPSTVDVVTQPAGEPPVNPSGLSPIAVGARPGLFILAPYRSQFDGDPYEGGNCGPATLAMAMGVYGVPAATAALRESVNRSTGDWSLDGGSDWPSLVAAARDGGLRVDGLFDERGRLRQWTFEEVVAQAGRGRPMLLLVRYRLMPGHEESDWIGDHYVLFLGLTLEGQIVYHDSAFRGELGAERIIDRSALEAAWSNTWVGQNRTAMALVAP